MAIDVGYLSAAGAGALSFLSPCVLPLVPPYLCYMAGVSVEQFQGEAEGKPAGSSGGATRFALFTASLSFVLGFTTVFVMLGAGASTIGAVLRAWQQELAIAAGIVIIIMGLNFLGLVRIPFLSREARFQSGGKPATRLGAYIMGLAFAFGWTPCIGPVLGSILTLTAVSSGSGAVLLAAYSLGLGIPFLVVALAFGKVAGFMKRARYAGHVLNVTAGAIMITMGLLMMTGRMTLIAFWLLERFPGLAYVG